MKDALTRHAIVWFLLAMGPSLAMAQEDPQPPLAPDQAADQIEDQTGDQTEDMLAELDERLGYVEEAMDEVEKRSVLDRLQLSADYRLIFNHFRYEGPSPDPRDVDPANPLSTRVVNKTSAEIWSHRLRIPIRGEITKNLRLNARLTMFKHFGDSDQTTFLTDFQGTRVPRDAGVRFEQAWIDWFVRDWLSISAGRLSYGGVNPPGELKENANYRIPTWGLHAVDGEYEVLTAVFDMSRFVLDDLYARFFYGSWFQDYDDPQGEVLFLDSGERNQRIFGWSVDLRVPRLGNTFVQVGQFFIPRFPAPRIPIPDPAFDPQAEYTNAPPPYDGSLLFPSVLPNSLGSFENLNLLIETTDVRGLGLDAFLSTTLGFSSPNGKGIEYELPSDPTDPNSPRVSVPFLFLAGHGDSGLSLALRAGFRYALPFEVRGTKPRIGLEYNYGSRYAISFGVPNDQLVNKWAVRGHAVESYVIVPIYQDHVFVRAGMLYLDNNFRTGFVGPDPAIYGSTAPRVDQSITNFNMVLHTEL